MKKPIIVGSFSQFFILNSQFAHPLSRLQRAAAHKHPQPPEQRLFVFVQQVVAPVDRVAQGLLARRQVARAAGQHLEPVAQSRQQRLGRKELDARGG